METEEAKIPSMGEQLNASLNGKSLFDENGESKSQEQEPAKKEGDEGAEQGKEETENKSDKSPVGEEKKKEEEAKDKKPEGEEGKETPTGEEGKEVEKSEEEKAAEKAKSEQPTGYDLSKFKEEAGDEFETPEDVVKAYKELKSKDPLEGQPFLQKLRDLSKDGHEITPEFINQISVDYKSMNPDDPDDAINLVKAKLRLDEKDLSPDKIDFLAKQKMFNEEKRRDELAYKYDVESDSDKVNSIIEQEKKDHNLSLSIEASKAHKTLSEYQDKLVMPKEEQTNQDIDAKRQKFEKNVADYLKDFKGLSTKVGEDEVVEVNLDEETAKTVQSRINHLFDNPAKFFEPYGGVKGAAEMVAYMEKKGDFSKEIEKRVSALTEERVAKELKNQKPHRDEGASDKTGATSTTRAIADAFTRKN